MTGAFIIYISTLLLTFHTPVGENNALNNGRQELSPRNPLLNGRIWRNQYRRTEGHQFFVSGDFAKGSVVYNGLRYENLDLQYDIASDELLLRMESYPVIIMNKEMVDSFSLMIDNRHYDFFNAGNDTTKLLSGYVNLLYDGPTSLYAIYSKKVQPLGADGIYDLFTEEHKIFILHKSEIVPVESRRSLLKKLGIERKELRRFQSDHNLKISGRDPSTFASLTEYYDGKTK